MFIRRAAALTLFCVILINILAGGTGHATTAPSSSPTPSPTPLPTPTPEPVTHRDVTLLFSGEAVLGMNVALFSPDTGDHLMGVVKLDTEINEPVAAFDNVPVGGWDITMDDMLLEPATVLLGNTSASGATFEIEARKPVAPSIGSTEVTVYVGRSETLSAGGLPAPRFLLLTLKEGVTLSETGVLSVAGGVEEGEYQLAVSANNGVEPSAEAIVTVKVVSDNTALKTLTVRGADMDVDVDIGFNPNGNRFEADIPEAMHGVRITAETFGKGDVTIYGYGRYLGAELPIALYPGETALTLDITASDGYTQRAVTLLLRRGGIHRPAVVPPDTSSPRLYSGSVSHGLLRTFAEDDGGLISVKWQIMKDGAFKDINGANAPYVLVDMPGGESVLRVVAYDAAGNLRVSGNIHYDGGAGAGGDIYARTQYTDIGCTALARAELRAEPSYYAQRLSRVYRGDALRLRGVAGAFVALEYEGRICYVHASHAATTDADARIDAAAIRPTRLLSKPNGAYATVARLKRGQTVRVARFYGGYAFVETEGASGYVPLRDLRTCAAY